MKNPLQRHARLRDQPRAPLPNPYQENYGLRDNPFPSLPLFTSFDTDPRVNGEIYDKEFRKEEERSFFEKFVLPPVGGAPRRIGFIRLDPQAGGRGNGKSTFLHHLMTRINEQDWYDWPSDPNAPQLDSIAVHLLPEPRKQNHFFQLIRLLFDTLHQRQRDGRTLAQRIDEGFRAAIFSDLLPEEAASLAEADDTSFLAHSDGFFASLADHGIAREDAIRHARERLLRLSTNAATNDLLQGFLSHGLSLVDLKRAWDDERRFISDYHWKRNGTEWLVNGLAPVLSVAGYQRLYILLDEFEKIYMFQTSKRREEFLDSLRQAFLERPSFVTSCKFISTILSIHPSIDPYLSEHWIRVGLAQIAPLSGAGAGPISVHLGPSTQERLEHLLITYLNYYRSEDDPGWDTLLPFEDGALDDAIVAARSFPRDTLRLAHMILERAATEGLPPPISADFVDDVLEESEDILLREEDPFRGSDAE